MMNCNIDKDDLFGQIIVTEIKEFPKIIFKYQLEKYNQGTQGNDPEFFLILWCNYKIKQRTVDNF